MTFKMPKKSKIQTPEWILKGEDNPTAKKKNGKTFRLRKCPKCGSDSVSVVLGEEEGKSRGEWECKKCGWKGPNVKEEELSEEEFMKYLDEKGEEVA